VRTTIKLTLATLATAGIAACGDARATAAASDDLKRDLQLASSTTMNLVAPPVDSTLLSATEAAPKAAPAPAKVVKRAQGPRAIATPTPTVRAEPVTEVAALDESEESMTVAEAPAPEVAEPVAVAPRPAPPAGDYGDGINGGGVGASGGGTGVVIRGGGVDGDNCELHRRRPGSPVYGGGVFGGPVFIPRPTAPTTGGGSIFVGERTRERMSPRPTRGSESVAPRSVPGRSTVSRSSGGFSRGRMGR
jgi:hypothetical protein